MAATGNNPQEEQNKQEKQTVDTSALDKVTQDIHVDELTMDSSAADKIKTPELKETLDKTDTKKPNINIKSPEDTLGIGDISQYIQKTKEQAAQSPKLDTLTAKDGTDLLSIPGAFAVVPHKKGDHKLVILRENMQDTFIADSKNRKKGTTYEKNGIKVYDVHADFMQHPELKTTRGEPLTIWVVDSKDDLLKQLQSIHGGVGGGTNFGSPVYAEVKTTETEKSEPKKELKPVPKPENTEEKKVDVPKTVDTLKPQPQEAPKKEEKTEQPNKKRELPKYEEKTDEGPVDLSKVVKEGDKKIADKKEQKFVLPDISFDKEGNAIKNTESDSEKHIEPPKVEEKIVDTPKVVDTPKQKPQEAPKKPEKVEEKPTPPPFMLDLDDIAKQEEPKIEPPKIEKQETVPPPVIELDQSKEEKVEKTVVIPPTPETETPEVKTLEHPVFDLDAMEKTQEQQPTEESSEPTALNLDTITEQTQTIPVSAPKSAEQTQESRHKKPAKRSSTGLKIRIAGLIALPLLLLAVLIVMFPSLSSDKPADEITPLVEQPVEQPTNPTPSDSEPTEEPEPAEEPNDPEPTGSSFTMNELKAKLESQQIEARRVLNKAKLLDNREAIKFGTAALLKASKTLDLIKKNTTTADEVQKDAERVDYYLQKADEATQ